MRHARLSQQEFTREQGVNVHVKDGWLQPDRVAAVSKPRARSASNKGSTGAHYRPAGALLICRFEIANRGLPIA